MPAAYLDVVDLEGELREVQIDRSPFLIGRGAEAPERIQNALVRIAPPHLTRTSR